MLQINLFTDLFFASFIPGTAAALSYANLLVQTPLGIISNVILVPFLPIFSRLADPMHWPELKTRIRQSLLFTALTMLPLGASVCGAGSPIVRVIYERGAFDQEASALVTSVLMVYGLGMFVYLARDVLVRVFYALGDGQTPFRISLVNIVLNGVLDLSGSSSGLGPPAWSGDRRGKHLFYPSDGDGVAQAPARTPAISLGWGDRSPYWGECMRRPGRLR
jgi:putative peptidoglycan lipid II flippase